MGRLLQTSYKINSLKKAKEILRKNLEILETNFNEDTWAIAKAKNLLGEIYLKEKDLTHAENLLLEGYNFSKKEFGENDFHTKEIERKLKSLYLAKETKKIR